MSEATDHEGDDAVPPRALRTVVVFTGGSPPSGSSSPEVPEGSYVIAADSGVHTALAFQQHVDLVIGDLDSASPDALQAVAATGAHVERHPIAKDHTDLELALDRAAELSPDRIIVVGGYGGRLDHFLANALVLASDRYRQASVEAHLGEGRVHVVHDELSIDGMPGDLVTLLAVGGPAHGVTTTGLLYPLAGDTLVPGSTRGVSNQFVERRAGITLVDGVLLVVAPGAPVVHDDHRSVP